MNLKIYKWGQLIDSEEATAIGNVVDREYKSVDIMNDLLDLVKAQKLILRFFFP